MNALTSKALTRIAAQNIFQKGLTYLKLEQGSISLSYLLLLSLLSASRTFKVYYWAKKTNLIVRSLQIRFPLGVFFRVKYFKTTPVRSLYIPSLIHSLLVCSIM